MKKIIFCTALLLCSLASIDVVYAAALDPDHYDESLKTGAMKMTPGGKLISREQIVEILNTAESIMSEFNLQQGSSKDFIDLRYALTTELTIHLFNGHKMPEARALTAKALIEIQRQQIQQETEARRKNNSVKTEWIK
jgi:hypothetical protein